MTGSQTIKSAARELAAEVAAHIAEDGQQHRDALTAYQEASVLIGRNRERESILRFIRVRGTQHIVETLTLIEMGEHR